MKTFVVTANLTSFLSLPREVLKQIVWYRSMSLYRATSPHADGLLKQSFKVYVAMVNYEENE